MSALTCQECLGYGYVTADVLFSVPVPATCRWCNGSGEVTPEVRGIWLREQRDRKKDIP